MFYKKNCNIILLIIIILICNSCGLNRTVILSPLEPYLYEENNIRFWINKKQNYWIHFVTPLFKDKRLSMNWTMHIDGDTSVEYIFIESLVLTIEDLNITISKQNIHHLLPMPNYGEEGIFFTDFNTRNYIYTDEIRDEISEKLSMEQAFNRFKKVKKIIIAVEFLYKIDDEEKNMKVIWNYTTRNETSNAIWDNWMGI